VTTRLETGHGRPSVGRAGREEVAYGTLFDFVTEAGMCKDGVCRFGENVIVCRTFFCRRESLGCQVLIDEKCKICTTWWFPPSTMPMRLEHTDITVSPGFSGHRTCIKYRRRYLVELNCKISASSSTQKGRIDSMRHQDSRCAYSRFSSSMTSNCTTIFRPTSSTTHSIPSEYSQEE